MKRGFFVTGTDTNVGKTVVSAALICALRGQTQTRYWKPIQTGIEIDDDSQTVKTLANCSDAEIFDVGYRLEKPFSPHLSAKLADVTIKLDEIECLFEKATDDFCWIIEGAGGILVPLNENDLLLDLIQKINLPVLVAARSGLGTINHTLLTVAALRGRDLKIAGVIMNGEPNTENRLAIEHFGQIKVLAELPQFEKLDFKNLNNWAQHLQL